MPVIIEGKEEKRDYLVMEYCENGDLIDFLLKYVNKQTSSGSKIVGLI